MAKAIHVDIKFDSNGKAVFANLRGDAEGLAKTLTGLQGQVKSFTESLGVVSNTFANIGFLAQNCLSGVQNLSAGFMDFDKAMRQANTMAGKSGDEFSKLKESIKDMSTAIPLVREELADSECHVYAYKELRLRMGCRGRDTGGAGKWQQNSGCEYRENVPASQIYEICKTLLEIVKSNSRSCRSDINQLILK